MMFLAEHADDPRELRVGRPVHDIGGAQAFAAHAHIERPVFREGETPLGFVELHRGNPDIEDDAVDPVDAEP